MGNLSLKKNSTEKGCSCTSEGMNISTARGLSFAAFIASFAHTGVAKAKITPTSTENMSR